VPTCRLVGSESQSRGPDFANALIRPDSLAINGPRYIDFVRDHCSSSVRGRPSCSPEPAFQNSPNISRPPCQLGHEALPKERSIRTYARYLKMNGWNLFRRRIVQALAFTLLTGGAVATIVVWADHLSNAQRNGGSANYSWAFIAVVLCVVIALLLWTGVATSIAIRVEFSRATVRCEAVLAWVLSGVMVAIAVAVATWWQTVGANAPWFIQGSRPGSAASPFSPNIVLTMLLMVLAGVTSIIGVSRIAQTWRAA
jgi:hypothetical protein